MTLSLTGRRKMSKPNPGHFEEILVDNSNEKLYDRCKYTYRRNIPYLGAEQFSDMIYCVLSVINE